MINLLLGGPGGGKSYEAVCFHVLPALKRGRKVITNLPLNIEEFEAVEPGCSALIEIRTKTLAVKPDEVVDDGGGESMIMNLLSRARAAKFVDRPFAHVEDFATEWRHPEDGMGPLFVIDECHFVFPRIGTPRAIEEWFSMHRHFNIDVLLITQSSGKISPAIRDLVQVCYKVRKAIAFGKPNGYIRKVLDGVNGGEVSVSERKYKPQMFKLYRSHTQGLALDEQGADDVSPLLVRFNRFKYGFYVVAVSGVIYAIWGGGPKPKAKARPVAVAVAPGHAASAPGRVASILPVSAASAAATAAAVAELNAAEREEAENPEPFKAQQLHLTGWMRNGDKGLYTFAVSAAGMSLFTLTLVELEKSGYKFEPLGECAGRLRYGKKIRTVICDAPVFASGRNSEPVVIDSSTGHSSRGGPLAVGYVAPRADTTSAESIPVHHLPAKTLIH
jgi:zona occludens toxin